MISPFPTSEGFISLDLPAAGKPCQTFYKLIGSLEGAQTPLVALHGGPGACHEYLLPLADLHATHGIPILLYDQIGNGESTRLPEKAGDESFWTESLFSQELDAVLRHFGLDESGFDLLGHSWGGMLAASVAARKPRGLRKLVLASAPASAALMAQATAELRTFLPRDVQAALDRADEEGNYESQDYEDAIMVFYQRHLCRLEVWPEEMNKVMSHLSEDPTVYSAMWGASELSMTGTLKTWTVLDQISKIEADTLLINGRHDEMTDATIQPFFDKLARVKWVTLEQSSHMGQLEERERFMQILGQFLLSES